MTTRRRQQFVAGHLAWMLGAALLLTLLDSLTYDLFFVISMIGFLIVVELTAPFGVRPQWRRRLRWLIALGLVVFGIVIGWRMYQVLPAGVL